MYERLLVPLDGSGAGQNVLPYAAEIAARLGSEVFLVSVTESKATDIDHLYRSYLERVSRDLKSELREYGSRKTRIYSDVLLGSPAEEILRYADESNVSLVIMGSRGSSGRGPWLLGNIAAKVLRATSKPVLLIRAPAKTAAIQERRLLRKVLVPLDGSKIGEAAILVTEALARPLSAELVLFQVLEPVEKITTYPDPDARYVEPVVDEKRRAAAQAYLDGVARLLKERGFVVSTVVATGSPPEQIVDYAEGNDIDLIAMSTHGRSGIGRWVFGSVTDKVIHAGNAALLIVRATPRS